VEGCPRRRQTGLAVTRLLIMLSDDQLRASADPVPKARNERALRPCKRSCHPLPMDEEAIEMAKWEAFRQCPGCGFDFATGEGERSCSSGDCPNLPEELTVESFRSRCALSSRYEPRIVSAATWH
jgi:hypothetical protein